MDGIASVTNRNSNTMMLQYIATLVICWGLLAAASHASPVADSQTDRDHRQMKSDNGSGVHLPEVKIFDTQINQNGALSLNGAGSGQAGQISQMPFGGIQPLDTGLNYVQGYPGFSLGLQQQGQMPQLQWQLQQQQLQQQQLQQQQLQQQPLQQQLLQQQPLQQQQLQQQQLQHQLQQKYYQQQQLLNYLPQQQQGSSLALAGVGLANYNLPDYPTGSLYAGNSFAPASAMGAYANHHIGTLDQLGAMAINHQASNPSIVAGASVIHQQISPYGPAHLVPGLLGPGMGPFQPLLRK